MDRRGGPRGRPEITVTPGPPGLLRPSSTGHAAPLRSRPTKQTKTQDRFSTRVKLAQSRSFNFSNRLICAGGSRARTDAARLSTRTAKPPAQVRGADASSPANGLHKCMPPDHSAIENTIGEQWIAVLAACEPYRQRTCRAQSLYCANRFPRHAVTSGSGARDFAERRNKAIAPYD